MHEYELTLTFEDTYIARKVNKILDDIIQNEFYQKRSYWYNLINNILFVYYINKFIWI